MKYIQIIIPVIFGGIYGLLSPAFEVQIFAPGFGVLGFIIALFLTSKVRLSSNKIYNFILVPLVFTFSGIAYGSILNLRYETIADISEVPVYFILMPIAAASFVFMFCLVILSIEKYKNAIIKILLLISIISSGILYIKESLWISGFIASTLVWSCLVMVTLSYFKKDSGTDLGVNLLFLFLLHAGGLVILPMIGLLVLMSGLYYVVIGIGIITVIIALIGNIFHLVNWRKNNEKGLISFRWLFSLSSIVSNYSIILSFLSVINYLKASSFFQAREQIGNKEHKICLRLGLATLSIYLLFFGTYETLLVGIWTGFPTDNQHFLNALTWGLTAWIAAHNLKIVFSYEKKSEV
ncbi:MAG: hypothetical protein ABJN36_08775 [Cyclobacteriaceae bacterium]